MIDWWASKMGMLIFVTVVLGSLLAFAGMQVSALSGEKEQRIASDLARMIDSVGSMNSSYSEYTMELKSYFLYINAAGGYLELNGNRRYFLSKVNSLGSIQNKPLIKFKNINGVVNVS